MLTGRFETANDEVLKYVECGFEDLGSDPAPLKAR